MLEAKPGAPARARHTVVPVLAIVVTSFVGLYVTGSGDLPDGDGSTAVSWAIIVSLLAGAMLYRAQGNLTVNETTDLFMRGVGGLFPIVLLLLLAFVMGDTCQALGTSLYIAGVTDAVVSPWVLPAAIFLVSCVVSFSTGTSWGTWAIMFPIAIPMMELSGLHPVSPSAPCSEAPSSAITARRSRTPPSLLDGGGDGPHRPRAHPASLRSVGRRSEPVVVRDPGRDSGSSGLSPARFTPRPESADGPVPAAPR